MIRVKINGRENSKNDPDLEGILHLPVMAMMKEIVADARRIWTRMSSNCSTILSQRDLSSSASSSFDPYFSNLFAASC